LFPEDSIAPPPSEPGRASRPAITSAPTSSSAPIRIPTSRTAAIFQRALLSHIAQYRHYPDQARRDRVQGKVQLVFAMQRDGMVTDVWVKASSGHDALDLAAVDTIRKAQPLPKIPSELPDQLNISVPVAFDLP
jgi:periplasmic protein TonB